MNKSNPELRQLAREALNNRWGLAAGTTLVYILILMVVQVIPILGAIGAILITGPMALGMVIFSLNIARKKDAQLENIFQGFQNFGNAFLLYLLTGIFTFLWTLLLIIPGIIAAYSYMMAPYIMADDNSVRPMEAIDKSKKMMEGHKMRLFILHLSFIGWALLCTLTLGIGYFWLVPYIQVSQTKFYDDLKGEEKQDGYEFISSHFGDKQ